MNSIWGGGITNSPEETIDLGVDFAKNICLGDIVCLVGELASGKTTFIKGILKGLQYSKEVTSPTFTLINEYNAIHPIIHIDCYRENNMDRWIQLGLNDYMNDGSIMLIEWAEKIFSLLPENKIIIKFSHIENNKRKISLLET